MMVRHRAIRNNNGPKIITNWKFDLVDFFEKNHTKYFLAAHRFVFDRQTGPPAYLEQNSQHSWWM